MKKFLFDCGTRDATASLGLLVLRVSLGLMMLIGHGIPKIENYATLVTKFKAPELPPFSLMSPQVSLISVMFAEVVASSLIILGLATRPAAFIFAFAMVVAAFGAHGADPWFSMQGASKESALLYLVPAVAILLTGAGLYSLDAVIPSDKKRRRW